MFKNGYLTVKERKNMHSKDKDFIKKLRVMFATLFARSMTKVIVGCPGLPDNIFIYSNITIEDMEYFEPNANYYLHQVEFLDSEFFEDLVEQFPVFKDTTFMLYTDKFLSVVGKHVGDLSNLKMDVRGSDVVISASAKDGSLLEASCGEMISAHLANQYLRVFEEYRVDPIISKEKDLLPIIQKDAALSFIDVDHFTDRSGKCVLLSAGSGVSIKEFPAKADLFEYEYTMLSSELGSTVRINTRFKCPLVSVTSVQPATVWFTKSKIKKDIENVN